MLDANRSPLLEEIEEITAWVEGGFVMQPLWLNKTIEHVTQAQFSMAHGLSVGAHARAGGQRAWQSPEVVFDPSVLALMEKIHFEVHPDYETQLTGNAASRPTRIQVRARGQTFVAERRYPRGSPSPDPSTRLSNEAFGQQVRRQRAGRARCACGRCGGEAGLEPRRLERPGRAAAPRHALSVQ